MGADNIFSYKGKFFYLNTINNSFYDKLRFQKKFKFSYLKSVVILVH